MLDYIREVATSTDDITTFKILINSTLSTENAKMLTMDIKNYYVGTPLPRYEYMRLPLSIIPDEIITKYNLQAISVGGWAYLEKRKCMYGLTQAGLLANQLLQQRMDPRGYYPARHTPGFPRRRLRKNMSCWSSVAVCSCCFLCFVVVCSFSWLPEQSRAAPVLLLILLFLGLFLLERFS
jgi:hypothetical protein